jgi:hypothetical protein
MDRVTFATASGIVWLALSMHFAAGLVAIVSGTIALPLRIVPLLLALGFAPILFLVYWMWRVRLRGRLTGLVVGATQPS